MSAPPQAPEQLPPPVPPVPATDGPLGSLGLAELKPARSPRRRTRVKQAPDSADRGVLSAVDWKRRRVRWSMRAVHGLVLLGLIVVCVGPMLWLAKAAVSHTQDTLRSPMALWPSGLDLANLSAAWNEAEISHYFANTVWMTTGSWIVQLLVATTGGFVLSVLRPRYAPVITAAVFATLFVPAVVMLIPLFLTVLDVPILGLNLVNTYWAVWLPAGANAFNVLLVKRFMDNLPREVFEAARVDGAGPFRLLWSVVLPMSKPILGVVSVFAILNAWKDFLWPMVALPDPQKQPLSVRLPIIRDTVELDVFLASLLISTLLPIVVFLLFQRLFLRNAGLSGAVKS